MCNFVGMKQKLSNYIKENATLRQLLLKQDGGIMKFWAEHPDSDFDVDLFDDYENQIVKDYLQENKQNRSIRSLTTDKLKNQSLDWYHQSKGSELKFIVALKSELNAIDSELYEQFLKEVDIYMVDAYKESRRRKYPEGIPPQVFYNEVIEKYAPFGLSLDCLEHVLQEYRGKTVALTDKNSILTLLRQLNGLAPTTPELEDVNNLQTEFDIRMFVGNFFDNGGYKKLRQAIKEIIDNSTQNLTEKESRELCRKIAIDEMRKFKQFTRWVNDETYPMKESEGGQLVYLITPEEKHWLQNIMYENSPSATGAQKLTTMDRHFCHFISILQDIGKIWAAQLLVHGIDLKELEKETGIIVNRRTGMLYYVDRFIDDQRGDCCVYDWPEAKSLLAKVKSLKEEGGSRTSLPKELNTPRARTYFAKAVQMGYMQLTEDGKYRWIGTGKKPSTAELAYFLGKVYNYKHTISGNAGENFPEESLNRLFGVRRLYSSLTQVYNAQKPQRWRSMIDAMFQ